MTLALTPSHTPGSPVPSAADRPWNPAYDGGDCTGTDPNLFFPPLYDDDAPVVIPNAVKVMCGMCPFVGDCLKWAMTHDAYGFWAGTSRYQRHQLGRDQHRARCPGCSSSSVMNDGRSEVCLACGISWVV